MKMLNRLIAFILIIPISYFANFDITLILLAFQQIVFETLSLAFFFQGLNQLKFLVYITLISKFLSTSLCILFIHKSNQIILFPIFLGFGNMASLFYSYFIANKKYGFHFQTQYYLCLELYNQVAKRMEDFLTSK